MTFHDRNSSPNEDNDDILFNICGTVRLKINLIEKKLANTMGLKGTEKTSLPRT